MKNNRGYHIALAVLVGLAAFLRLFRMPDRAFANDVWLWAVGINLHKTHIFNIGAHVTENFFKSLICTPYGWADTLPAYIATLIYNLLGIPISEYWLYFMHVFMILLCVVLIYVLGKVLFNPTAGLICALLLSILPIDITVFGSLLCYHHAFLMLVQLAIMLSLYKYMKAKSFVASASLSVSLLLAAGTEILTMLPVVLVFQYLFELEKDRLPPAAAKRFIKDVFDLRYLCIWLPAVAIIALNVYISLAYKSSNLGMFCYTCSKYMDAAPGARMFNSLTNQLGMVYRYFFNIYAVAVGIIALLFFAADRSRARIRMAGLFIWFAYMFSINVYFGQGFDVVTFRYSHFFLPLILIAGYMTYWPFRYAAESKAPAAYKKAIIGILTIFFGGIFVHNTMIVAGDVLKRKVYHDKSKSASFYVREHGNDKSTVFQLISIEANRNYRGEYYFGKLFMEPPEWTGLGRGLFSFGDHSIEDYKKAYGLSEFDFYIDYYDEDDGADEAKAGREDFLNSRESRGLKRAADIKRGDKVISTIYSPHPLPYEIIDADKAEKEWDGKYANLKKLLPNRWCGLSVLRGYHHRLK